MAKGCLYTDEEKEKTSVRDTIENIRTISKYRNLGLCAMCAAGGATTNVGVCQLCRKRPNIEAAQM